MNIKLTFFFVLLFPFLGASQLIHDIEIDKIYYEEGDVYLVNESFDEYYECDIEVAILKTNKYSLSLYGQLEKDYDYSESVDMYEDIIKMNDLGEFKKWLKSRRFSRNYFNEKSNSNHLYVECAYDEVLEMSKYTSREDFSNIKREYLGYARIVYFRVNQEFLIAGILRPGRYGEDRFENVGLIIPTKDGGVLTFGDHSYFGGEVIPDQIIAFKKSEEKDRLHCGDFFGLGEIDGETYIVDRLEHQLILPFPVDSVKMRRKLLVYYKNNEARVFNPFSRTHADLEFQAVGKGIGNGLQVIHDNQIKWLDQDMVFKDTIEPQRFFVCGTVSHYSRTIDTDSLYFNETLYGGRRNNLAKSASYPLVESENVKSLLYLTDSPVHKFNENSKYGALIELPYSIYKLERDKHQQLVNIFQEKKGGELIVKTLLTADKILPSGYYQPVKFIQGDLFGYYPQNKEARYKKIEKFNHHFAPFVDKDGRKGWLDLNGNEYFWRE